MANEGGAGQRLQEVIEKAEGVIDLAGQTVHGDLLGRSAGREVSSGAGEPIVRRSLGVRDMLLRTLRNAAVESGEGRPAFLADEVDRVTAEIRETISAIHELSKWRTDLDNFLRSQHGERLQGEETNRAEFSRRLLRLRKGDAYALHSLDEDSAVSEPLAEVEPLAEAAVAAADEREAAREEGRQPDPDVVDRAPDSHTFNLAAESLLGRVIGESVEAKKRERRLTDDLAERHAALAVEMGGERAVKAMGQLAQIGLAAPDVGMEFNSRVWRALDVESDKCERWLALAPDLVAAEDSPPRVLPGL